MNSSARDIRTAVIASVVLLGCLLRAQNTGPAESGAIVFDSEREGQAGVFVMAADGTNVRRALLTPETAGFLTGRPIVGTSPSRRTVMVFGKSTLFAQTAQVCGD